MNPAGLLRFLHVLGVVLWLGVGVASMFLTARARRSGRPDLVAFAYRTSSVLMKTLGLAGMLLTVGSGFALIALIPGYGFFQPFPHHWLFQMQLLGTLAFLLAALYQLPVGDSLARAAEASASAGEESASFRKYRKRNAITGSVVGLLLLVNVFLGAVRP